MTQARDARAAGAAVARASREEAAERVAETYRRIKERGDDGVWITVRPEEEVLADLDRLDPDAPLYGVLFAVKDNIDVAGLPTTAACPGFAYRPERTAPLVERLRAAGALLVGKTNLDQFATGLSGMRTPYGVCEPPDAPGLIPGGSSSGSAVAVAAGLVDFAVGTDTAGSGRVPAAMTGTVGLKPSRGLVPTTGIVPACASLDCASVFAPTVTGGAAALAVMAGPDPGDPWSRELPAPDPVAPGRGLRIGVPARPGFLGDEGAADGFAAAAERLARLGHEIVPVDMEPFLAAGSLLYEGPWLAERLAAVGDFLDAHPDQVHPVTRRVLEPGRRITGVDVFRGLHRLAELRAETARVWRGIDVLAVPTVPTTYTQAEMAADPVGRNADLGRYTNFCNLLDLAAVAVPAGRTPAGRPHGVTLMAPAGTDGLLAGLAAAFLGEPVPPGPGDLTLLAVVGAHRTGHPLHPQLAALGAVRHGLAYTAPVYRLHDLGDRPGMIRRPPGERIEVELHRVTPEALGRLLVSIPPPLGLGTVELDDGRRVHGFLCEPYALADAPDITAYRSWPAYLASRG